MGMQITDGTGEGFDVKVDSKNRIRTLSTANTEEHTKAQEGVAFFASNAQTVNKTLQLLTTEAGALIFLKNNSSIDIVVQKLPVSTDTPGVVFNLIQNMTEGTLTNNTSAVPANFNLGSSNQADVELEVWDEVGTTGIGGLTGGVYMNTFILNSGTTIIPIDGALVIPQGQAIVGHFDNVTGGTAEVTIGFRFYFDGDTA